MISKELLSEIFDWKVKFVNPRINDDEVSFIDYNGNRDSFNVYYVAHKCKEWAYKKGFSVNSRYWNDMLGSAELFDVLWSPPKGSMFICDADTEVEAIFKACEWILYNKDKHDNKDSN